MNISRAIKLCRAVFSMTQTELANRVGIGSTYLSLLECGHRNPRIEMTQRFARVFGIPVDLFVLLAATNINLDSEQADRMAKAMIKLLVAADREKQKEQGNEID